MKRFAFSVSLLAVAIAAVAAEPSISDVSVCQLWPWSGDVDIAFTVSGTNTDVTITAQYDGVAPFVLAEKDMSGDFLDAAPGRRHVRWSPARAGLDAKTLVNFRVLSVEPDTTDRTYLILNLKDGSYRYMAAPPEDGWKSNPAYYQTNMVFRRIPGGEAVLGLPTDLLDHIEAGSGRVPHMKTHRATLSSDYYMAVFLTTDAQHKYVMARAADTVLDVSGYNAARSDTVSYDALRGTDSDDGIDWPNTQYAVAGTSIVAAYRKVVANTFSSGWIIDLPSTVQWERAARADTPTNWLWSVGGTVDDSMEEITNVLDQVAVWIHDQGDKSRTVGQRLPNGWGLYDMIGLGFVWTADWYGNSTTYYSGTDPVGPASGTYRARRSAVYNAGVLDYYTTAAIGTNGSNSKHNYRLCIHLKSLFSGR